MTVSKNYMSPSEEETLCSARPTESADAAMNRTIPKALLQEQQAESTNTEYHFLVIGN